MTRRSPIQLCPDACSPRSAASYTLVARTFRSPATHCVSLLFFKDFIRTSLRTSEISALPPVLSVPHSRPWCLPVARVAGRRPALRRQSCFSSVQDEFQPLPACSGAATADISELCRSTVSPSSGRPSRSVHFHLGACKVRARACAQLDRFERLESQVTTLHSGACILPYSPHSNPYASFTIAVKDFVSGRVQKYTPSRKLCVAKYNYDLWAAAVRNWILRYLHR